MITPPDCRARGTLYGDLLLINFKRTEILFYLQYNAAFLNKLGYTIKFSQQWYCNKSMIFIFVNIFQAKQFINKV